MIEIVFWVLRGIAVSCRGHHDLILENMALRQQLRMLRRAARPRLRARDRMFWVLLARSWRSWRSALVVVQPDTVIRWHREWLRRRWARCSGRNRAGRPPLDAELRQLIIEMATANPLWGAPRIHGELQKLGMQVSERTVSRLLAGLSRPPSQTWRTFLANHVAAFASMDFFTVSTLTGRLLFVFIILSHDRRRILHVNCTARPTSAWTGAAAGRGVPRRHRATVAAARPRQHLR